MCDTLCSLNLNNENKSITYFAKNSDREPNEIQVVEYYPSIERKGKTKLTYIEVETLGITNEIVISRPEWMWGAEMGFNEHGVSIGNEAIFTRNHLPSKGLLGMDLLRLGLEYGNNARKS
ncbi:MAG: peptidase U34, partial [Thermoplasmata archaeon]